MKTIHKWLQEEAGLRRGITSLTSYISRIRRREAATKRCSETSVGNLGHPDDKEPTRPLPSPLGSLAVRVSNRETPNPDDPLAQAMGVLSKPRLDIRKIHNDGDPEGRNLI